MGGQSPVDESYMIVTSLVLPNEVCITIHTHINTLASSIVIVTKLRILFAGGGINPSRGEAPSSIIDVMVSVLEAGTPLDSPGREPSIHTMYM